MSVANLGVKSYARISSALPLPGLVEVQLQSYEWLLTEGLLQLFDEISPIESFNGLLSLYLPSAKAKEAGFDLGYRFGEPKHGQEECLDRDLTYAAPLYVDVALVNRETSEIVQQEIFLGDLPLMTESATFIINGTERVVVSQLIRSPGVYFGVEDDGGRRLATAKLIPDRGAWMEFETRKSGYLTLRFNRKRTIPVTIFLRALAAVDDELHTALLTKGDDEELLELFGEADNDPDHPWIANTIRQEPAWEPKADRTVAQEAMIEFYRRMRPGDPPTLENAQEYLVSQLFDPQRYNLQRVGRYKLNQRMQISVPAAVLTITKEDIVALVRRMIHINNGVAGPDDMDHLGNRRVKTVGELVQAKIRVGLVRMERVVKERMSIREESPTPVNLVNIRPVVASIREFFGSSQLSQFMEQTNPLSSLTHKRTLSALGPGGLRRERAGFDVRDVHHSHYGRICPIETPEGPNIGLIGRLSTYGRVNELGFIETPYRRVVRTANNTVEQLRGEIVREDVLDPETNEVVAPANTVITPDLAERIAALPLTEPVKIVPHITDDVVYLSADREEPYVIAQANAAVDEKGYFRGRQVAVRKGEQVGFSPPDRIDLIDVAPIQIVGVSAALIPFLEHDDANRALMGSNMQRQAVPLIQPEAPYVGTGVERAAALNSGLVILSKADGVVLSVTGDRIVVGQDDGEVVTYNLKKYARSNQSTCIDQRPNVTKGQRVTKGAILADSSSTQDGKLALGQNVLVAFMSWEGGNYEDAILLGSQLVQDDRFTSVHIEKYEVAARDTKLGPEEVTREIPNVSDDALRDLDEEGIVRVGAEVGPLDILVGKITPKGEKELTPEEKLLRAIFGEKLRDVKDTSLRMPHGAHGKVVEVKVFDREEYRDLPAGVERVVRVSVAQRRKITEGDKMAGRHGNKGVISQIVPVADMPFLADGTPIDAILNPLGVPGRMNIGQVLETHLGWASGQLGFHTITPVFDGADEDEIAAELARSWLIEFAWDNVTERAWAWLKAQEYPLEVLRDDDEARLLYIVAWLAPKGYKVDTLRDDRHYARRAVLQEWLKEKGYNPTDLLSFEDDTRPITGRKDVDRKAQAVCLRIWMETHGQDVSTLNDEEVVLRATEYSYSHNDPLPTLGKMILYDGKTGMPFDRPITVGIIYIMKLAHLVEDKVHTRSTGPYSLVTQQPLGGKAQFGGQRFGEMEVWALEAYGAAYTLQEMLTIKSDDVQGRVKAYESIVKGLPIEEPGIPASFKVLVKELQSLALAVEAVTDSGEVLRFGRDDRRMQLPKLGMGLLGLTPRE
ncbi:MAG TPA: DNA-directed RNA polymerase subunit beta [Anaerolineae bacterium]|nr:DNA-directed RNA polymerase subunit beta [Anaerolineae bacterium]HQI85359.1 DNA-directed RNA polymerase subunit beta [Anaerolineae bacterium]